MKNLKQAVEAEYRREQLAEVKNLILKPFYLMIQFLKQKFNSLRALKFRISWRRQSHIIWNQAITHRT